MEKMQSTKWLWMWARIGVLLPLAMAADSPKDDMSDEFSNNLFSDLAPLLTLFGERVATQYLRHSTSQMENLIFACGPMGLVTAVTSAIRIAGERKLKALIGRAEEPDPEAELQLVSSTSTDICELWNGVGLVRVIGKPKVLEVVYDQGCFESDSQDCGLYTRKKDMKPINGDSEDLPSEDMAPNLSLNTVGLSIGAWELRAFALVGVLLQLAVLVFDGTVVYCMGWTKGANKIAPHAFPLTVFGTLGVSAGMYLCAYIIENSTKEMTWKLRDSAIAKPPSSSTPRVVWIQRSHTVGEQSFESFAIYAPASISKECLRTSHRMMNKARFHNLTLFSALLSTLGFITQFVGFREMHFSASLGQLIITAIMTLLRAVIRRHIAKSPEKITGNDIQELKSHKEWCVQPLIAGFELDIMAKQFQSCRTWQVITFGISESGPQLSTSQTNSDSNLAEMVYRSRLRLTELAHLQWQSEIHEHAKAVSDIIINLSNLIWSSDSAEGARLLLAGGADALTELKWEIPILTEGFRQAPRVSFLPMFIRRERIDDRSWGQWEIDLVSIEALLQLWMLELKLQKMPDEGNFLWLLCDTSDSMGGTLADVWMERGGPGIIHNKSIKSICKEYNLHRNRAPDLARIISHFPTININEPNLFDNQIKRAVVKSMSIGKMCVQYILSRFLTEVTKHINTISDELVINHGVAGSQLSTENIRLIAHQLRHERLVAIDDAYRITVCALYASGKLPSPLPKSGEILRLHIDSTKELERLALIFHETSEKGMILFTKQDRWWQAGKTIDGMQKVMNTYLGDSNKHSISLRALKWKLGEYLMGASGIQDNDTLTSLTLSAVPLPETDNVGDTHSSISTSKRQEQTQIDQQPSHGKDLDESSDLAFEDMDPVEAGMCGPQTAIADPDQEMSNKSTENGDVLLPEATSTPSRIHRLLWYSKKAVGKRGNLFAPALMKYAVLSGNIHILKLLLLYGTIALPSEFEQMYKLLEFAIHQYSHLSEDYFLEAIESLLSGTKTENLPSLDDVLTHKGNYGTDEMLSEGNKAIINLLMGNIDIRASNADGETLLHLAVKSPNIELIRILLKSNCPILEQKDLKGLTPLHYAAGHGRLEVTKLLLESGANIENKSANLWTALYFAVVHQQQEMVHLLMKRGADVHVVSKSSSTLLHQATMKKDIELVKLLCEKRVNINAKNSSGMTALHYAAQGGKIKLAQFLLEHSADPRITNNAQKRAQDFAQSTEMVNLLRENTLQGTSIYRNIERSFRPLRFITLTED